MIIIIKLKLIKFYDYNNKMLLIINKEFDNKILTFFFKRFLKSKYQL